MEKKIAYGFETNVSYDFFKPPLKEIARTLLAGKGNCGGGYSLWRTKLSVNK